MPLRHVFVALAIVCIAIALLLARGRGPGTTPSVLQGPEPERLMPRGSPAAGAAPEPVSVAVAPPVVQAPATTVPPGTSGPSPAVRAVAARQALERFGRDATFDIERCAGVVNAPRALIPVQIVARPLPDRTYSTSSRSSSRRGTASPSANERIRCRNSGLTMSSVIGLPVSSGWRQ